MMRCAVFLPMPGTLEIERHVLGGHGAASASGESAESVASATFGPTP